MKWLFTVLIAGGVGYGLSVYMPPLAFWTHLLAFVVGGGVGWLIMLGIVHEAWRAAFYGR